MGSRRRRVLNLAGATCTGGCYNLTDVHGMKEGKSGVRTQTRRLQGPAHHRVNLSRSRKEGKEGQAQTPPRAHLMTEHLMGGRESKREQINRTKSTLPIWRPEEACPISRGVKKSGQGRACRAGGRSGSRQRPLTADKQRARRREELDAERTPVFGAAQGSLCIW